ncbi:putative MFS family arabinose efflux permease [Rathayibacter sp. PhB152]|uniref:MFS transporter n=1 Tax=Rathayibacter sp. PhB152 TaxID=2485190 RepID=UPI000FA1D5DB|nr:MFS transporter [Rathayibacter sp. PhB152]ROQ64706.1 putative MFS family arabinose efflux permease [Rathayibacter sp. PhB152]
MNVHGTALAPSRHSIAAWRNAVMVMFTLGGVTVSTWGPRLPSIRDSLGIGDAVIGLALAGVTVGSIAGLGVAALLLSKLGARRAILGALLTTAAGVAVVGLGAGVAGSLGITIVGFVAVGLGVGSLDVMINVEGAAVEAAVQKTLMPLLHAAWSAGAILGSVIGAGASAAGIRFEWQFCAEAVLIAIAGLIAVRYLPAAQAVEASAAGAPASSGWRQRLRVLADWRLLLIGVVMFGAELGEGTANSWLSLSARDGHGQTETVAALFFTVFALGETIARVVGGPVVDRIGRVATIRITAAVGVLGLVLFILGGPTWLILLGTVLWAVGVSMGFPLGMSAAADSGPNPAARVSIVASVGYLANLAGPPVIGGLSESFGLLNAFWLVAALLAAAFLAAGAYGRRGTPIPSD